MIKNIMTFIAVASLLATVSCKKKEENTSIVLDANNMITSPQYPAEQTVIEPKKTMKLKIQISTLEILHKEIKFRMYLSLRIQEKVI